VHRRHPRGRNPEEARRRESTKGPDEALRLYERYLNEAKNLGPTRDLKTESIVHRRRADSLVRQGRTAEALNLYVEALSCALAAPSGAEAVESLVRIGEIKSLEGDFAWR